MLSRGLLMGRIEQLGQQSARRLSTACAAAFSALLVILVSARVQASTYVAYIPLDSSIYDELETLNDLGMLDSYLPEIKPISRVEAARLTVEAGGKYSESSTANPLVRKIIASLREQLAEEVGWIENDSEDGLPTMIHPVERAELSYVYSAGRRTELHTGDNKGISYQEATPLLPYNDDLPTVSGNNEAARWAGWMGVGSFITGYGEGAIAGGLSQDPRILRRAQLVTGAVVADFGNVAISFGQEEMDWGVGEFGQLSQTNNALPFPALRAQNVHPGHLPGFLRYLGLFRWQAFFGQGDSGREFSNPWIDGQIFSFKPLPSFEWGITHNIMFGGVGNNNYTPLGFVGRATGFDTGNPIGANTNSRFSLYLKYTFQKFRMTQIYGEDLGEDFFEPFGKSIPIKTPFKSPSYIAGIYCPEVTADGLTTARFEWSKTDQNYSTHSDSLYWTYDNRLMGDALGPGAWQINFAIGRWFDYRSKLDLDAFYTIRNPHGLVDAVGLNKEQTFGATLDFLNLPIEMHTVTDSLAEIKARAGIAYVSDLNYTNGHTLQGLFQLTLGVTPAWPSIVWR